jgi:hypothetical protein
VNSRMTTSELYFSHGLRDIRMLCMYIRVCSHKFVRVLMHVCFFSQSFDSFVLPVEVT